MRRFVSSCIYLGTVDGTAFTYDVFEKQVEACGNESTRGVAVPIRDCIIEGTPLDVEGVGEVTFTKAGEGAQGIVLQSSDGSVILKLARYTFEALCRDRVTLSLIDGLNGRAPKLHRVTSGLERNCSSVAIVMDRVGDHMWIDFVKEVNSDFYRRMASLITAYRDLHAMGLSHMDVKGDNIRVDSQDPTKVWLVDFGLTQSLMEEGTNNRSEFFRTQMDLEKVLEMLIIPTAGRKEWMKEFRMEVDRLKTAQDEFRYDYWIDKFNHLADSFVPEVRDASIREHGAEEITEDQLNTVRDFNERLEQCEQLRMTAGRRATISQLHTLDLEGFGKKSFGMTPIVRGYDYFNLYRGDSGLMLRIAIQKDIGECRDKVSRAVLDGIGGHLVEVVPGSIDANFWPFYSVISDVGDDLWSNVVKVENREFYSRFAALLRMIKEVHCKGLIVFFVQGAGLGVSKSDPTKVYLLGMHLVMPYINQASGTMETMGMLTRKTDMRSIADLVGGYNLEGPRSWLDDFRNHIDDLDHTDRPDYDRWINCFENIESDDLVDTC